MTCGIYKITNIFVNKVYIGSSKDVEVRIKQHFSLLKNRKHHSIKLQRAYDKYGLKSFTAEVVEECDPGQLLVREQVWMDELDVYRHGYNCSESSTRPTSQVSHSHLDKNSKWIDKILSDFADIQAMRSEIVDDVFISIPSLCSATGLKNVVFRRLAKATEMVKYILTESKTLDRDKEYRISHVNYINKKAGYCLQEETSKKQSTHKRYRTNSIYDRLVQLLFSDMEGCKYRKIILKELKEKGIVFDPPKDNVPPVDGWGYE